MSQRLAKKVLLLGWDAADWKIIKPLLEAGLMPNLERLVSAGVMGKLLSLQPMLSPMLWNSISTGKRADKHGVLGFIEPDPLGGIRPVTSTSRRCKALWNILTQSGFRTHVLGWFASHPAEPINGVCVTNQFGLARGSLPVIRGHSRRRQFIRRALPRRWRSSAFTRRHSPSRICFPSSRERKRSIKTKIGGLGLRPSFWRNA